MIVSLGDAVVDLVALNLAALPEWGEDRVVPRIALQLGGSAMHVATNLAAFGNEVALLAGVGQDDWSDFLERGAAAAGVNGAGMKRLAAPCAVTMVLSGAEDRAFVSVYGATAAFAAADLEWSILERATHLHVSGLWQSDALRPHLPALFDSLRERGVTISLDTGYDPTDQWGDVLPELLSRVDVFFPNEIEAARISGEESLEAALAALARRIPLVAMKLGEEGARVRQGEQEWERGAFPVQVVDTTGAGDAFDAGFLHGWLHGWPMEQTLEFANATGGLAVARVGASENPPTLEEVRRFIAQHAQK